MKIEYLGQDETILPITMGLSCILWVLDLQCSEILHIIPKDECRLRYETWCNTLIVGILCVYMRYRNPCILEFDFRSVNRKFVRNTERWSDTDRANVPRCIFKWLTLLVTIESLSPSLIVEMSEMERFSQLSFDSGPLYSLIKEFLLWLSP